MINIGGSDEISIKYLAERIKELTDSESEIRFLPYEEVYTKDFEDMQRRVPSIEKIEKLIGWKPKTGLDDILMKVIEYYQISE